MRSIDATAVLPDLPAPRCPLNGAPRYNPDQAQRPTAPFLRIPLIPVEQLCGELTTTRETGERQQAEAARLGVAELATVTAQLAAARELVETTKTHAAERVADYAANSTHPPGGDRSRPRRWLLCGGLSWWWVVISSRRRA